MPHLEYSAIISTFIKLPFVIKIFVLSIFEWPFYTGFTVLLIKVGSKPHRGALIVCCQTNTRITLSLAQVCKNFERKIVIIFLPIS